MTTYIICASPRSGSTLLCDLLRQSGAGIPSEYLHAKAMEDKTPTKEWVEDLIKTKSRNGVFGIKIMWVHLRKFMAKLSDPKLPDEMAVLNDLFHRPKFVMTSRRDVLAQAISWSKADQTSAWCSKKDSEREAIFDRVEIMQFMERLREFDATWRSYLQSTLKAEFIEVPYEDLAADMPKETGRVLDFLGLPRDKVDHVPSIQRQSDEQSEYWMRLMRAT